jgi:hypothetical protein
MRVQRIKWFGRAVSMERERMVKRITDWGPTALIVFGVPRLGWENDVRPGLGKNEDSELE